MSCDLSILICHLEQRDAELQRLLQQLAPQLSDRVEVLTETDTGELPTGTKRNLLIARSTGAFTAFIDDDDTISSTYVADVLAAIDSDPTIDCVGLKGIITFGGTARLNPRTFIHSIECAGWYEANGVYYRTPNHLNPIASRHSKALPFPDITVGEDHAWSDAIRPQLHSEVMVDRTLYYYEAP
jgi:hypothetical protein